MKDIFVSKIKRLAVAMFAAFCVGSVWADVDIEIQQPLVIKSDGTLDIAYTIYYWDTSSKRYFDCKVTYNEEGSTQKTTVSMLANHAIQGVSNSNQNTGAKYSDTYTLTGLDPSKTYVLSFKAEGMKVYGDKGSSSMGNNWKERTGIYTVILSGISSASATWKILPTKEFVVSGVQDTQLNVTKAKIRYEIGENLTAFSANAKEEVVNFTDGKFEFTIPYENLTDDLLWSVWGQDANGNEYLYRDGNGVSLCLTERTEVSYATYTWTGAADNGKWTDVSNWTANNAGWGFPGLNLGSATGVAEFNAQNLAFRSTVRFEGSAEVDLEGNRYEFLEQDDNASAVNTAFRGFEFSKPADLDKMSVVLKNGTIGTKIPEGYGPHLLGAAGVELEFRNAEFKIRTASNYLRPNTGATIVFSGEEGQTTGFKNQAWNFAPNSNYANSRLVFRNFSGYTYYSADNTSIASGSVVELVNAQWKVRAGTANTAAVSKGFAERVILRDGADRQAMIKCMYYANNDDQYANVLLNNTYDIKIPAAGHTEASIWAKNLTAASTCTFELDVTDFTGRGKVPLVRLESAPAFTLTANLVAKANGEDVTFKRRARLVWEGNTLYYDQKPDVGFRVIVR